MINARAETVLERPTYRGLVRKSGHRCLVVADGWYEWQKPEDPKQPRRPIHFSLGDGKPFCFAGLWTTWAAPDGGLVPSCTIVTCAANEVTRPIHDRMPVVLAEPAAWEAWLDPELDGEGVCELLAPLPSAAIRSAARTRSSTRPATRAGIACNCTERGRPSSGRGGGVDAGGTTATAAAARGACCASPGRRGRRCATAL